jgi:hypothetical protein
MQAVPLVFLAGLVGFAVADKTRVRSLPVFLFGDMLSEAFLTGVSRLRVGLACVRACLRGCVRARRCAGGGGATDPRHWHPPPRTPCGCVGTVNAVSDVCPDTMAQSLHSVLPAMCSGPPIPVSPRALWLVPMRRPARPCSPTLCVASVPLVCTCLAHATLACECAYYLPGCWAGIGSRPCRTRTAACASWPCTSCTLWWSKAHSACSTAPRYAAAASPSAPRDAVPRPFHKRRSLRMTAFFPCLSADCVAMCCLLRTERVRHSNSGCRPVYSLRRGPILAQCAHTPALPLQTRTCAWLALTICAVM